MRTVRLERMEMVASFAINLECVESVMLDLSHGADAWHIAVMLKSGDNRNLFYGSESDARYDYNKLVDAMEAK